MGLEGKAHLIAKMREFDSSLVAHLLCDLVICLLDHDFQVDENNYEQDHLQEDGGAQE